MRQVCLCQGFSILGYGTINFSVIQEKNKESPTSLSFLSPISISSPHLTPHNTNTNPHLAVFISDYQCTSSSHGFQLLPSFWFLSFLTLVLETPNTSIFIPQLSLLQQTSGQLFLFFNFFSFLKVFTCLAASGISCNTQDLCCVPFCFGTWTLQL